VQILWSNYPTVYSKINQAYVYQLKSIGGALLDMAPVRINPHIHQQNSLWYMHTMEYHPARKRNEVLIHMWMNLRTIVQSRRSHIQMCIYDSVYVELRKTNPQWQKTHQLVVQECWWGLTGKSTGYPLGDGNVLYLDCGGYMDVNACQNSLSSTLKMGTFYI